MRLARLARFCYRRRRLTVAGWIAGLVVALVVGFGFAAEPLNDFSGGNSGSAKASDILDEHFPKQSGDEITLAVYAPGGVQSPEVKAKVEQAIGRLAKTPHVSSVSSPYATPGQVSKDGKTAFAAANLDVTSDEMPKSDVKKLLDDVRTDSGPVQIELGGSAVDSAETPGGGPSEGIGVIAAMVILLVAFGSVLAMGLPILTALFGIGTGLSLIMLIGHLLPAPSFSPIVAALIGLGVGIDYALFIVTRYREELHAGNDPEDATVTAVTTAGRAVLFAGTTVVIALMGLFVMQQSLLNGVAVAAGVTVLMTMFAAVTLLPALLGFAGRAIDRLRLPGTRHGAGGGRRPLAERWARVVQRHPVLAGLCAAGILLVLAVPALSMRLSLPDSSVQPHDHSGYQASQIMARGFGPGTAAPLILVTEGGTPADAGRLAEAVRRTPGVAAVQPPRTSADGAASIVVAFPTTGVQDEATPRLVHTLRDDVIPGVSKGTGAHTYVGGQNAASIDFAESVSTRLPWLIAVVVGLSLLLLVVLVRSLTVALQAAVMNLLSIAAAYGVVTAVVQWGWAGRLLGFPTDMPVTTWVPLMMFPILFGLSMDYEVFLVSRIRETYESGVATREAVALGLSRTARVITAAAAIMVMVFLSVLLGADVAVKQMGLGLGVAILIDATVVRLVLVPALMELFGEANWWLPRPLARLLPPHRGESAAARPPAEVRG
ncbi:MMPL family transporter [Actinomadura chibensis]|uniref:MMPL family transporter n=1 Tax=Actinomadura chibensis TaxID=392828 RepID=A0A5D0NGM7_9ACTN|nr:MMPL family transporter [Actinomadura chibensis]TYB43405.1 MMPL family transporter [Actinomadura chibensis]